MSSIWVVLNSRPVSCRCIASASSSFLIVEHRRRVIHTVQRRLTLFSQYPCSQFLRPSMHRLCLFVFSLIAEDSCEIFHASPACMDALLFQTSCSRIT